MTSDERRLLDNPPPQMAWVDRWTDLLDTRFRIPGTNIRFGVDFLMGLVPGAGSMVGFGFSGLLIATMARHGASGALVARMLVNAGLDAVVGSIPLIGNAFDLFFKANRRNLRLMRRYYGEGRYQGSASPYLLRVILFIFLFAVALIWLIVALLGALINWIF